jgi:hypothetical protein
MLPPEGGSMIYSFPPRMYFGLNLINNLAAMNRSINIKILSLRPHRRGYQGIMYWPMIYVCMIYSMIDLGAVLRISYLSH